jgi:hypothetical protein
MASIDLASGHRLIFDDQDETLVLSHRWYAHHTAKTVYARGYRKGDRKGGLVYLHRLLVQPAPGADVDHINGDGLDNRRANLRAASRTQNNANRRIFRAAGKGAYFDRQTGRWRAEISHQGRVHKLGRFPSRSSALAAYDAAATKLFGEFALINGAVEA